MIAQTLLRTESTLHKALRARLNGELDDDEFVGAIRGACSEEEFLDAIASQIRSVPELTGSLISLMHRLSRRGEIRQGLIPQLRSRIADRLPCNPPDGITIELRGDGTRGGCLVAAPPLPTSIEPGTVLRNRYVIQERLGKGGKGTVFKALDRCRSALPAAQQYVAVKVLHQTADSRLERLEALRRELQCAQALSHPNVVKVFDLDRDGDLDFFTMEFLEGELLSSLLMRFRVTPMPRSHAWSIIRQVAAGLKHAHERDIVHADLKPQNILITNSGEVRILDFGASHTLSAAKDGSAVGSSSSVSLAYASCELLEGRTPDPRDDLYALACICFELLAGEHPFQRRRSNEARYLGVVPVRPKGLSRRQWNTLGRGLSWHRAGRSMHIRDWLKGLKPGDDDSPSLRDIQLSAETSQPVPQVPYFRASLAVTLLLVTGAAWLLFVRVAPGGKVIGEALRSPQHVASVASQRATPAAPELTASDIARPKTDGVAPSPLGVQIAPRARFAEVRIRRPARVSGGEPFVWWTEGASAKPGIDYVSQSKATQFYPAGRDSTSVFVKLLPRPRGNASGTFYIAVAERADKNPDHVTHTAVHLPGDSL
jgi:serine/threonine protein kinase